MSLPDYINRKGTRAAQPAATAVSAGVVLGKWSVFTNTAAEKARPTPTLFVELISAWMTLWTVGPTHVLSRKAISTALVFTVCHRFEMCRIYAGAITAQMIDFQSSWYRTLSQFIRDSVGVLASTAIDFPKTDTAVSGRALAGDPRPARIWTSAHIYFCPKALFDGYADAMRISPNTTGAFARAVERFRGLEFDREMCPAVWADSINGHGSMLARTR